MYKPKEAKLFGAAIKQLLTDRGLSQRQFARKAGLDASYVSKLVNPKPGKEIAEPSKKIRQQLAKGLDITEQELLEQIARYSNLEPEEKISNPPGLAEREKALAKNPIVSNLPESDTAIKSSIESNSIREWLFKSIDQLWSTEISEHKAAIYKLERIAKDYPTEHWGIMEKLAEFVRTNAPRKEADEERSLKLREDIQAALTVIGGRNPQKDSENQRLDLSNSDLRGAILKEANLQGVNFYAANLQGIFLNAANLQGAILEKANLQKAFLSKAILHKASFYEANLQNAFLTGANLQEADLYGANLQEAVLDRADLQEAFLNGANLRRASFIGANLQNAHLYSVKNLKLWQIEKAFGNSATVIPANVERPANWM